MSLEQSPTISAEGCAARMVVVDPEKKWWWFFTDDYRVEFAEGFAAPGGLWYFRSEGTSIPEAELYKAEKDAVEAAKEAVRKRIAFYKEKLDALNKR
jgi:hypothetical protein